MKEQCKLNNKGFSLIELLLTVAISGMVFGGIYSFVALGTRSYNDSEGRSRMQSEVQMTFNILSNIFMEGSAVTTSIDSTDMKDKLDADNKVIGQEGFLIIRTGRYVVLYVSTDTSLYIYDDAEWNDTLYYNIKSGQSDNTDALRAHLLSKNITEFEAERLANAIRISVTFKVANRSETITNLFKLRGMESETMGSGTEETTEQETE